MRTLVVLLVTVIATACNPGCGSCLTSGFPSLDEIQRNGSLLNKYSTHDGELRSVPGVQSNCSMEQGMIIKVAFIALPGVGDDSIELLLNSSNGVTQTVNLSGATKSFGDFGYELDLTEPYRIPFTSGDILWIKHPYYNESSSRLVHQVGHDLLNICWRFLEGVPSDMQCWNDNDYPLLAFETASPGCIDGPLSMTELKSILERRTTPLLYSSPYRELTLGCNDTGYLYRILVGTYLSGTGVGSLQLRTGHPICNQSTLYATEHHNVFECILDPPIEIGEGGSIYIEQRNTTRKIVFLHDGQTDTPLISVNISDGCNSSGFLREDTLREMATLFIPNFIQVEDTNDIILYPHLDIVQEGFVVKWTFTAEDLGVGSEGPVMRIYRYEGDQNVYMFSSLQGSDAVSTIYPNVYQFDVDPPLPVYAGDYIGLILPPIDDVKLLLSFILNDSPPGQNTDSDEFPFVDGLPLITLEIETTLTPSSLITLETAHSLLPSTESDPVIATSTAPHSMTSIHHQPLLNTIPSTVSPCSPTQSMCQGGQEDDIADKIIIISTVTSVSLLLITITVVIICILLWLRKRQRKPQLLDNVAYNCHGCEIKEDNITTYHKVNSVSVVTADYASIPPKFRKNVVDIATSANEAYNIANPHTVNDVVTAANVAYGTTSMPSRSTEDAQDIPTSENEAYIATNIATSDNPAYVAVTNDDLEYDYI